MSPHQEKREGEVIVIKPAWWRQAALTLFLFFVAIFFQALQFRIPFFNMLFLIATIFMAVVASLNLLDQFFAWSRLRIDHKGYSLRAWFRRIELRRDEVEDFLHSEYMRRMLIVVKLTEDAASKRGLPMLEMPFPCTFGRPADEVFQTLRESLGDTGTSAGNSPAE